MQVLMFFETMALPHLKLDKKAKSLKIKCIHALRILQDFL